MSDANQPATVYVIDDDAGVRRALARVFKAAGFLSSEFSSTDEFIATGVDTDHACVLSDMHIAGETPAELPRLLEERGIDIPVIFISADDSDENLARVNQAGGVGFFRKPVDDQALIDAIKWAIRRESR